MSEEELKKIIRQLLDACKELMAESGKRRAADWEIVNDAMVAGERALREKKVPVTIERWFDGVMADSQDMAGETPESLRDKCCPKSKGWEHFEDEGIVAARKARAVYLFRGSV